MRATGLRLSMMLVIFLMYLGNRLLVDMVMIMNVGRGHQLMVMIINDIDIQNNDCGDDDSHPVGSSSPSESKTARSLRSLCSILWQRVMMMTMTMVLL